MRQNIIVLDHYIIFNHLGERCENAHYHKKICFQTMNKEHVYHLFDHTEITFLCIGICSPLNDQMEPASVAKIHPMR